MSVHALLNITNELRKRIKMPGLSSISTPFHNFLKNNFNKKGE